MASLGDMTIELDLDMQNFTRGISQIQSSLGRLGNSITSQSRSLGNNNRNMNDFSNSISGVNNGVQQTSGIMGVLNSALGNVGGSLGTFRNLMAGGLAVGIATMGIQALVSGFQQLAGVVKDFIAEGLQFNSSMEKNTVAFEVLLGSQEAAVDMMKQIQGFADVTPFSTEGLVNNAKMMKSFGIETEKLMPNLKMLGDIALGDSEKMGRLTLAFSQIHSTGRLMGQDLLQLVNAGFNPLQIMSEKTGKTMGEMKDAMSDGAISAELVQAAFESATAEGGLFYKGMEKLGKSFEGRMSTLRDTMTKLKGALTKPFFDFLSSNVLPMAQKMLEGFMAKVPIIMSGFSAIWSEISPIMSGLYQVIMSLSSTTWEWLGIFMNGLMSLAPALSLVWEVLKGTFLTAIDLIKGIADSLAPLVQAFQDGFSFIHAIITGDLQSASQIGARILENLKNFFVIIWQSIGRAIKTSLQASSKILEIFGVNAQEVFRTVANKIRDFLNWAIGKYNALKTTIEGFSGMTLGGQTLFAGTKAEIKIPEVSLGKIKLPTLNKIEGDFAPIIESGFNKLFWLNDAIVENTDAKLENSDATKTNIDWAEKFNKLLGDGEGKTKKSKKATDELAKAMEDLNKKIEQQAKSFANFVGIFDKVSRVRVSANSLFNRLKGQVREMTQWRSALLEVGQKVGESSALFQELASKGPAAAGEIIQINRMSEQQLQSYQDLFNQKLGIATEVATIQQMGVMGMGRGNTTVNIYDNNIKDGMDVDIIAQKMVNKLKVAGVE